ncbi:transcription termination factor NusA [Neobittarella massiliensis]|uniref:Transcription termination/antitermination protein NusA n=2 Tax=Oscillospiraceae TaxID=216572 RepID=A0A8J6IRC1_9FIRM|nr:transcription termination factor NusA [Neobittarella massiliensis]MBC3516863.1 transcription termination/antitermination protein NusA [Neobittarella massiliensis]SCJ80991.1 Transcription elongation protein nusA [uncultured Anaerotruncus sp.]
MNTEFFEALALLEKEKGISADYLLDKIKNAIVIAVKKDYDAGEDNVLVELDPATCKFEVYLVKTAVEVVEDPETEVLLDQALTYDKNAKLGDVVHMKLKTKEFGRIAAQTAKHVIRQGIREAERGMMVRDMQSKAHEIVTATVQRVDPVKGFVTVDLGKAEAVLIKSEQVEGEELREGDRVKVYIVDVLATDRGPKIMISRTHPGLVKRLFEMEVPEIYDGTVEIKAVSREAGSRTKIAVWSKNEDVDPVGACIGPKGARVAAIVDELAGEKIDIVRWSEDPVAFISEALSPATVVGVEILDPELHTCRVSVPDGQLSLAIGNKGQNARLAAKLTGWKIDIRPESGFYGEEE